MCVCEEGGGRFLRPPEEKMERLLLFNAFFEFLLASFLFCTAVVALLWLSGLWTSSKLLIKWKYQDKNNDNNRDLYLW